MKSATKKIEECTHCDRMKFFELMQIEFEGVNFKNFIRDFEEKQYVMVLTTESGEIVGFSTLMEMEIELDEKIIKIIFSGDTTVLLEYRNSFGFGFELSKFFIRTINLNPSQDIYYALISKGWRTYKVLPFYFKKFFPCCERILSSYEKSLLDAFGFKKYPGNYAKESGLICFTEETERLKPDSPDAYLPERVNKHVDFFFLKNPTYLDGTELVCMAKVCHQNFTGVVPKLISIHEKTNAIT